MKYKDWIKELLKNYVKLSLKWRTYIRGKHSNGHKNLKSRIKVD